MERGCFIAIAIFFLISSFDSICQIKSDVTVSYHVENETLDFALLKLAQLSGVNINFNPDIIPKHLRVSISDDDEHVINLLRRILRGTQLHFDILNNQVVVYKIPERKRRFRISGTIENSVTGEPLIAANVYDSGIGKGAVTNENGFFSILMPEGSRKITCSFLGYQPQVITLDLHKNESFSVMLIPSLTMDEVIIFNSDSIDNGLIGQSLTTINQSDLKNTSGVGGEADLFRQIQRQAGVQTGADGLGGLSIRGGSEDQNLVVVDGNPIYYPNHQFGVFSAVNSEGLRTANFIKNNFVSPRGKRLSSEIGIKLKNGSNNQLGGSVAVNLIAFKASLNGPLSQKTNFAISGRKSIRSPIRILHEEGFRENAATSSNFSDFTVKLKSTINDRNTISVSGLFGSDTYNYSLNYSDDNLSLREDRNYEWSNKNANVAWTFLINDHIFLKSTLAYSDFHYDAYNISSFDREPVLRDGTYLQANSDIEDIHMRFDFDAFVSPEHFSQFGLAIVYHQFKPNLFFVNDTTPSQLINPNYLVEIITESVINALNPPSFWQMDLYGEHNMNFGQSSRLQLSLFSTYLKGDDINRLLLLPKISFQHRFSPLVTWSVYSQRSAQYFHKIDIDPVTYPNSIWIPISKKVDPKFSWLLSSSLDFSFSKGPSFKIEAYHNWLYNYIFFPFNPLVDRNEVNFESLDINDHLLPRGGSSYGLEFSLVQQWSQLNLTIHYTLSKTKRDKVGNEVLDLFSRPPLDRRHQINVSTTYKPQPRWNLNALFTYGTKTPATYSYHRFQSFLPDFNSSPVQSYERIHGASIHENLRVDLNANYTFGKALKHEVSLGVYNILHRRNELYRFVDIDIQNLSDGQVRAVKSLGRQLVFNYHMIF